MAIKKADCTEMIEQRKTKTKKLITTSAEKGAALATVGTALVKEGAEKTKKGVISVKKQAVRTASAISKSGKEAQMTVLSYVDKKKNARFLKAKMKSFEDGFREGKIEAVDYIKKYANFCLAATAISFFFAQCDGDISEEELLEIQFDLDAIIKNKDLPDALRNKLAEISLERDLSFDEVKMYLDGVSTETVVEFQKDIEEIIIADGKVTESEKAAKQLFDDYLRHRLEG